MPLSIQCFPSGPLETNAYILYLTETPHHALIIDPAPGSADQLIAFIEKIKLLPQKIILTHSHWDHIADIAPLKKHYSIPVAVHELDQGNLKQPGSDGLNWAPPLAGIEVEEVFSEGDQIPLGNYFLRIIHTPGHTPGGVCFYNPDNKILISGDTLFSGSIGNLSLPTANAEMMWASLDKLAELPKETKVFPGHGPSTTIGNESWLPNSRSLFG